MILKVLLLSRFSDAFPIVTAPIASRITPLLPSSRRRSKALPLRVKEASPCACRPPTSAIRCAAFPFEKTLKWLPIKLKEALFAASTPYASCLSERTSNIFAFSLREAASFAYTARTSKRFARTSILEDIGGVSFHKKTIPVQNGRTGINRGILYLDISTAADLDSSCKVFFKIALANAHILNSDIPGLFNIHSKPLDLCPIDQLKGLQDDRLRMILALNREPADQFWPLIARADLFEVLSAAKQGLTLTQD